MTVLPGGNIIDHRNCGYAFNIIRYQAGDRENGMVLN